MNALFNFFKGPTTLQDVSNSLVSEGDRSKCERMLGRVLGDLSPYQRKETVRRYYAEQSANSSLVALPLGELILFAPDDARRMDWIGLHVQSFGRLSDVDVTACWRGLKNFENKMAFLDQLSQVDHPVLYALPIFTLLRETLDDDQKMRVLARFPLNHDYAHTYPDYIAILKLLTEDSSKMEFLRRLLARKPVPDERTINQIVSTLRGHPEKREARKTLNLHFYAAKHQIPIEELLQMNPDGWPAGFGSYARPSSSTTQAPLSNPLSAPLSAVSRNPSPTIPCSPVLNDGMKGLPTAEDVIAREEGETAPVTNGTARDEDLCCVCQAAVRSCLTLARPCSHWCMCTGCARKIGTTTKRCPICRAVIKKFLVLHKS